MSEEKTTHKRKAPSGTSKSKAPAAGTPSSKPAKAAGKADAASRTADRKKATTKRTAKPRTRKPARKPEAARADSALAQEPATPGSTSVPPESPSVADEAAVVQAKEETPASNVVAIPSTITVRDLAALLKSSPINLIRELMKNGVMANINQVVDFDTAAIVAADLGFEAQEERPTELVEEAPEMPLRKRREYTPEEQAKLMARPPVVTIMGHVDHGKTSLLDVIRETNVVASEAGGITQHIGAYQVQKQGKQITFLDTPGHEAFTAMRARGAMATDIAVLVVAADDGVQPQTIEAIDHARAAQVPIIVALNKMDKANANPEAAKKQLADRDLIVEDYGGEVICVPVSAKQKTGLESLLEMILLVAEMADLKANPEAPAEGVVIEGQLDKTRGPLATLLVQEGTLRVGDSLVSANIAGKVKAMFNDKGERIDSAAPSEPAVVLGLSGVPRAGDSFQVIKNERTARTLAAAEAARREEAAGQRQRKIVSLDEFFAQAQAGRAKELNIILKADVQGSIEPIVNSVERLGDETLHANFLHTGSGNINESDIMLAVASDAIVIGFNVQADVATSRLAHAERVDIRLYNIIYNLVDDIDKALKGMLEPTYKDVVIGHAQVRAVFRIRRKKSIAGCQVADGIAARNALARVLRDDQVLFDSTVASLRRFKDDVREVKAGMECGVSIEGFDDFAEGDIVEFYRKEKA